MPFISNCGFVPTAGGTTDWTFSSAVQGYQSPALASAVNGAVYVVRAQSADNSQWEYSAGAYNSSTGVFARTEVLYNSSGTGTRPGQTGAGTKINFTATPSIVAVVCLAEQIINPNNLTPRGRLTLTSGTPITTTDVAGSSAITLYYTPFDGDSIPLFDGTTWINVKFAETSISLSGLTANTNYDIWTVLSGGALTLDKTAWTNDTTRATAIAQQDSIDVKSGDATRRLVGTIRILATGQTEDSRARRFVSNRYNDVPRPMIVNDPATTGTQAVGTSWRTANSNTANQLDYVCCIPRTVQAVVAGEMVYVPTGATAIVGVSAVGIGIDSVPANTQATLQTPCNVASMNVGYPGFAYYNGTPGVGRHTIIWIEYVQAVTPTGGTGTATWIYTNLPAYMCGISGVVSN